MSSHRNIRMQHHQKDYLDKLDKLTKQIDRSGGATLRAITKIQAVFRGKLVRMRLEKIKRMLQ